MFTPRDLTKVVLGVNNTGCPKKCTNRMEPWCHGAEARSPVVGTTWTWNVFFGRFLLILSRIKRTQVMPHNTQFWLYESVLLVGFFGTPSILPP